ncbi:hypothetical protein FKM82_019366 [Ascaphus truei]
MPLTLLGYPSPLVFLCYSLTILSLTGLPPLPFPGGRGQARLINCWPIPLFPKLFYLPFTINSGTFSIRYSQTSCRHTGLTIVQSI